MGRPCSKLVRGRPGGACVAAQRKPSSGNGGGDVPSNQHASCRPDRCARERAGEAFHFRVINEIARGRLPAYAACELAEYLRKTWLIRPTIFFITHVHH